MYLLLELAGGFYQTSGDLKDLNSQSCSYDGAYGPRGPREGSNVKDGDKKNLLHTLNQLSQHNVLCRYHNHGEGEKEPEEGNRVKYIEYYAKMSIVYKYTRKHLSLVGTIM